MLTGRFRQDFFEEGSLVCSWIVQVRRQALGQHEQQQAQWQAEHRRAFQDVAKNGRHGLRAVKREEAAWQHAGDGMQALEATRAALGFQRCDEMPRSTTLVSD
jgi:hypothetical protein